MDTLTIREELHNLIDKTEDINILKALKVLLKKQFTTEQTDFWDELPEALKAEIEEGLEEIERGEDISHEEVMKKYAKWG